MVFRNSLWHSAKIGAPPSFLSSRLTEVNTTCFSCIFAAASATLLGSSQSRPCIGRPVFTAQNEQERVQTSPSIIKVAVPAPQLVAYPIIDLENHFTDMHKYLRFLEEAVIRTCADFNIGAGRVKGLTGVWVGDEKICAMGIRCSRWVTMHGLALNVSTDLNYFDYRR